MTGFSRVEGSDGQLSWVWELRSVNGKGLDVRLRLPPGYESLDIELRKILAGCFKRGNLQASLQVFGEEELAAVKVNRKVFDSLADQARALADELGGEMPTIAELIAMRGVVEMGGPGYSEERLALRNKALIAGLKDAATELSMMRGEEGRAIVAVLKQQLEQISRIQVAIRNNKSRTPSAIRAQLKSQVEKLMESSDQLDEERLHQEAILLAAKSDLQEELDRIAIHVESAENLLDSEGPAGRKLDFLSQELNRECNTICSKSNAGEVSSLGLDMKLVIDQFREQLQNLE